MILLSDDHGAVRVLTMNRPEVRNALSTELFEALYAALEQADADDAVRAVVLTGADPAFCAGVDLKQAQSLGMDYFGRFDKMNCMNRIVALGKPVICGLGAVGAGPHARHEHIRSESVPAQTALLAEILRRLASGLPRS